MSEENNKGCFSNISNTWQIIYGLFHHHFNRVHPSEPILPKNSEFLYVESNNKLRIRIIHLIPEKINQNLLLNNHSKRNSLADDDDEEYWFMKSKPIIRNNCKCSFRLSTNNVEGNNSKNEKGTSNNNNKLHKFAEQLLEKTLNEAFNDLKLSEQQQQHQIKNNGIDNNAFELTEIDSIPIKNKPHYSSPSEKFKKLCVHNNNNNNTNNKRQKKPLIILIHGLGSVADVWNILMNSLCSKGFEVVAPDLFGHGFSSAPNKSNIYNFKNLLNQILIVFDTFMKNDDDDDNRKCILIGHSYGCSLITALYSIRASKISQLILISGGGPTPLAPPAGQDINRISPFGCAHYLCYPFMYCGLKRSFFYSSRGKNFKFCEDETCVPPHLKDYLIDGQYWPEGDASFHRRILVPTLLVHGLQDKYVTLVQECEMERTIPRSFLELIPDAGHLSMLESPEHLIHMIICFLQMWI